MFIKCVRRFINIIGNRIKILKMNLIGWNLVIQKIDKVKFK